MTVPVRFLPASAAAEIRAEMRHRGLTLAAFDGGAIKDGPALLAALGRALGFPSYYGRNWDAAEECLRDLGERCPEGCALLIDRAGRLWQGLPREMGLLTALWLAASDSLAVDDIPLRLIFLLEDDR